MIIIGKGVKAPANTKSTAKVGVIVGTSGKKKKKARDGKRKRGTKFKGVF